MTSSITRFIFCSRSHLMHTALLDFSFLFLYIHTMSIQIIFILTSYFLTLYYSHHIIYSHHITHTISFTLYYLHHIIHTIFSPLQCWRGSTQPRHSSGAEEEIQSYRRYVLTARTGSMYSRVQCTCMYMNIQYMCTHTHTHMQTNTHTHMYIHKKTCIHANRHTHRTHAHSSCMHHTHHTIW